MIVRSPICLLAVSAGFRLLIQEDIAPQESISFIHNVKVFSKQGNKIGRS